MRDYFLISRPDGRDELWKRALIFLTAVAVYLVAARLLVPAISRAAAPAFEGMSAGPKLMLKHILTFSLPAAVTVAAFIAVMVKLDVFQAPSLTRGVRRALLEGFVAGVVTIALTVLLWCALGYPIQLDVDGWKSDMVLDVILKA